MEEAAAVPGGGGAVEQPESADQAGTVSDPVEPTLKQLDPKRRERSLQIMANAPAVVTDKEAAAIELKRTDLRRQLVICMDNLLAKHTHTEAEQSLNTLQRLVGNLQDHPEDKKYHSVRTQSKVYQSTVAGRAGVEDFLLNVGFRAVVRDMQEHMTFHPSHAPELPPQHLVLAREIIARTISSRLPRLKNQAGPVNFGMPVDEKARREAVIRDFEDDRADRAMRRPT